MQGQIYQVSIVLEKHQDAWNKTFLAIKLALFPAGVPACFRLPTGQLRCHTKQQNAKQNILPTGCRT